MQLSKKERREQKYARKEQERSGREKKRAFRKIGGVVAFALVIAGGIAGLWWYASHAPRTAEEDIISKNGIHWHPHLAIFIEGKEQEIPTNIGIGVTHNPIHTHDASGEIHLEFSGLVKKDDIKLGNFFDVWGKQFSSLCVLDSCAKDNKTVKMLVNGKENAEFGNYVMQDKDKIEIRYE
ncbi:hypothetical protein HYR65_03375 [Candidatus Azambacteria bacterium]|nr:hypothetical protein [Candidatus Azambacteria bacterium]